MSSIAASLYFVRQNNVRNLQVVPLISPGGTYVNYKLHSVSFRVVFARDRSREHHHCLIQQETKNTTQGKKSQAYVEKGSRLFRESVRCGQLSSWNFVAKTTCGVRFVRPTPSRVGSPGRALRCGGHRRRHRGRFRRQKGDSLTASLSLFNIPVISASRRATRECCLCTHLLS